MKQDKLMRDGGSTPPSSTKNAIFFHVDCIFDGTVLDLSGLEYRVDNSRGNNSCQGFPE